MDQYEMNWLYSYLIVAALLGYVILLGVVYIDPDGPEDDWEDSKRWLLIRPDFYLLITTACLGWPILLGLVILRTRNRVLYNRLMAWPKKIGV